MPKLENKNFSLSTKLIFIIFGLLLFGIVMIYDSTFIYSQQNYGKPWVYALMQFAWVIVGTLGFIFFYYFDYKKLKKFSYFLFLFSLITLGILALVSLFTSCGSSFGLAPCVNGAFRWLRIPIDFPILGYIGFQPAELAKLALILYLSFQISTKADADNAFIIYAVISLLISGLVVLQPNMSTAVMIFLIGTSIYFVSGYSIKPFFILAPVLLVLGILLILLTPYRRERYLTFIKGNNDAIQNRDLKEDYHVKQISIALGSGGFSGLGLGQSRQKYQYLPEVATDSIFAVIGEELGFFGTSSLLFLYGYFLYLGFMVSMQAKELSAKLIATGITFWLGLQFVINISAMTKIIPLTGVPLPLISYGGSSMIFSLMALGILVNISKNS